MDAIGQIASRLDALAAHVRAAPPSAALRDAFAALRLDEIVGSVTLAGATLDAVEVRALLERGRALGGHRFDDYLLTRDYAAAAAWASAHARRRAAVSLDDLRTLHRLAVSGLADDGGAWRTENLPALPDGTVPPPHWMVAFETESFIGRVALGEGDPAPLALARAIARIARLRPFRVGNGRVARLLANLLAYRRGLPPLVLDARARRTYPAALQAGLAGDVVPLARLAGASLARGLERLRDAAEAPSDLRPLSDFAEGGRPERLYKAAQRGRLRVVRKRGKILTTEAWVRAYGAR
ncbi:MAG TPA: Fic family protein [Candidatus Baltobacteraceae bacterium]|nr:Fic family protein [Candidatus Baltobacteraceae bacterium]